ncbi:type-F conjugative transfer system secretin TraK [Cysteiniphilum litorale]|uniref:type-F conjugative transfer system secretin TraK n=2 Tax=Cysteiniphilum litorale TaxID=2056700 RepID=UPI003F880C1A
MMFSVSFPMMSFAVSSDSSDSTQLSSSPFAADITDEVTVHDITDGDVKASEYDGNEEKEEKKQKKQKEEKKLENVNEVNGLKKEASAEDEQLKERDYALLLAAMNKQGVTPLSHEQFKQVEQVNQSEKNQVSNAHYTYPVEVMTPQQTAAFSASIERDKAKKVKKVNDVKKVKDHSYRSTLRPTEAELIGFNSNQTLTIRLSKTDTNRLYVEGDKIIDFTCQQGFCFVDRGRLDKTGDVLLTLGNAARLGSGFTAFVLTESGRQFTLYGVPEVSSGKTIGFVSQGGVSLQASRFEKKTPYRTLVVSLMRSMMNYAHTGQLPDGYATVAIENEGKKEGKKEQKNPSEVIDRQNSQKGLSYTPVRLFKGGLLTGIVYAIQNFNGHSITLHPKTFYQRGMVAGALTKEQLASGEVGYFYALIQEGSSDV